MDSRLIKARFYPKKQLLLKDYLLDDFGSCSSNGFKSFPRRQCCSSVPAFLRESDPKRGDSKRRRRLMSFNKAFRSILAAVKLKRIPFTVGWKPSAEKRRRREAFGSGGWRRKLPEERKEIARWKSFDQLLKEDSRSSDGSYRWPAAVSRFAAECGSGLGDVNLDVTVTVTVTVEAKDVVAEETKEVVDVRKAGVTNDDVSESTTVSDGSISTNPKQKQWGSDHESKEQFSPMSILDCPFDDEDEEVSSPFQQHLARMEGTKKKLMKKIHMLESLAKLEPLNLATCLASKLDSDNDSSNFIDDDKTTFGLLSQQNNAEETESVALLRQIQSMYSSYNNDDNSNDKILLDFFSQGLSNQPSLSYERLLKDAQDWLDGRRTNGIVVDWMAETNRAAYLKDLEIGGEWKTLDQEIEEVTSMMESEVFGTLFYELLADMIDVL